MNKPIETIGVIKESRPDENRTPLAPEHIEKLKTKYPNLNINCSVQNTSESFIDVTAKNLVFYNGQEQINEQYEEVNGYQTLGRTFSLGLKKSF